MRKRENCNVRGMSIRTKLMITMLLILGFTLCAFWMLNYALLPGYYQHKKVSMLVDSYNSVNTITQKDQPQLSKNGQLSCQKCNVRLILCLQTIPIAFICLS